MFLLLLAAFVVWVTLQGRLTTYVAVVTAKAEA